MGLIRKEDIHESLLNSLSNPNLLINGDFKINQRRQSSYTNGYTVDRWITRSDAEFLDSIEDYIQIDEGSGDKYAHAQGNYLEKSLVDESGRYNYKFEDGKVLELTEEEKNTLFPKPEATHSKQEMINSALLEENANIRLELTKQKKINAEIMKTLAELGGK